MKRPPPSPATLDAALGVPCTRLSSRESRLTISVDGSEKEEGTRLSPPFSRVTFCASVRTDARDVKKTIKDTFFPPRPKGKKPPPVKPTESGSMVAVNKLEAFGDAMELAELCVETAQGLKQSLKDVRLGGPSGVAAASSSLGMAKSLVSLAKTATDVLSKAKSQWMLTAGVPPPPGYGASPGLGSGSRPGSRIGSSPGGSTPGSVAGGFVGGAGKAKKKRKSNNNNNTVSRLAAPVGPLGSLASPAPHQVMGHLSKNTKVPTDIDLSLIHI